MTVAWSLAVLGLWQGAGHGSHVRNEPCRVLPDPRGGGTHAVSREEGVGGLGGVIVCFSRGGGWYCLFFRDGGGWGFFVFQRWGGGGGRVLVFRDGGGYCLFFRDCRDGGLFFSEMGGGGGCIVSTIHVFIILYIFSVLEMLFQLFMLALYCMFVFSVLEMLFQPSMLGLYVCFQCPGDAVSTIHAWIVCLFLVSRSCCFNRLWLHDIVHLFSVSQSCCFSHQCLEWSRQDWLRRWIMCSRSLTFPHRTDCVRYSACVLGVN